jgi:hypothetical protein
MSKRILILDDEMDSNITVEVQDNGFKVDSYQDPILALSYFSSGELQELLL